MSCSLVKSSKICTSLHQSCFVTSSYYYKICTLKLYKFTLTCKMCMAAYPCRACSVSSTAGWLQLESRHLDICRIHHLLRKIMPRDVLCVVSLKAVGCPRLDNVAHIALAGHHEALITIALVAAAAAWPRAFRRKSFLS